MKKNKFLCKLTLVLAISMLVLTFTSCGNKEVYESEHVDSLISGSIRTLSDSEFTDLELVKQIYTNAFTSYGTVGRVFPKTLSEVLPLVFGDKPDSLLLDYMTGLYGGKSATQISGIDSEPTKRLKEKDLHIGDLLLVKEGEQYSNYIYDEGTLVDLSNPLKEVDTAAVLKALPDSDLFATLRILKGMTIECSFDYGKQEKLELTDAQEALLVTAQSYLIRGGKIQYANEAEKLSSKARPFADLKTPEDYTSDVWGYSHCADFCYKVYYHALGYEITSGDIILRNTKPLMNYSEEAGMRKYYMACDKAASYTEEDREKIANEIQELLEPGDILVVRRKNNTGHALLYVGNGNIIHSGGNNYAIEKGTETYEATVRQITFKDYFLTQGCHGYIFGSDLGEKVTEFAVVRPLDVWDGEIPETTKNRVKNLQNVMVQKLSSHNSSLAVEAGEEITYTFEIYNRNDKSVQLEVRDTVPAKTKYVKGADKVEGKKLSWNVEVAANERIKISYTVKVTSDAQKGDVIESKKATVGGVPVRCADILVNNMLTKGERQKIKDAILKLDSSDTVKGLEAVNAIYKKALDKEAVFEDTDFATVCSGENGVFKLEDMTVRKESKYSKMLVPTMYGGCSFAWDGRTLLAREHNIVVGDVIILQTDKTSEVYIYAGDGTFYDLTEGVNQDTLTAQRRLEKCLGTPGCYAILRPSFTW